MSHYQRIACLSTEAVETLYAIGAQEYIVGISGYTVRPPQAREEKPKISGFSTAKIERILAVKPDLVVAFSNLQADICRELIASGIEVHVFNQRNVAGILSMIKVLGALTEREAQARELTQQLQAKMDAIALQVRAWEVRPTIYFEEWNEPLMSGIGWVSELIQMAGACDAFVELSQFQSARERIIADPMEVVRRAPDIIIGSWCGKKFRPESLDERVAWDQIPALRTGFVREIKSPDILSPGPSAITHGLVQLHEIIAAWHEARSKSPA